MLTGPPGKSENESPFLATPGEPRRFLREERGEDALTRRSAGSTYGGAWGGGVRKAGEHRRDANRGEGGFFDHVSPLHRVFAVVSQRPFSVGVTGWCAAARAETYEACVHRSCHSTMPNMYSNTNQTHVGRVERARKHPRSARCRRATWNSPPPTGKIPRPDPTVSAPVIPVLSVIRGSWRSPPRCSGQSR